MNRSDGAAIYINNVYKYSTYTEKIGELKIISSTINFSKNFTIKISGLYRCFVIDKSTFLNYLKSYLNANNNQKNHCIVGDLNFDLMNMDSQNEEFLNNFLEMGYIPNFTKITRPDLKAINGGTCIDNIFQDFNQPTY